MPDFSTLANLHGNISADVWPNGAVLSCNQCGRTESPTSAECAGYLKRGWPTCCGRTMSLDTRAAEALTHE